MHITRNTVMNAWRRNEETTFIHLVTRRTICCGIIENRCVDCDLSHTRYHEQRNKRRSWKIIPKPENEREEN